MAYRLKKSKFEPEWLGIAFKLAIERNYNKDYRVGVEDQNHCQNLNKYGDKYVCK